MPKGTLLFRLPAARRNCSAQDDNRAKVHATVSTPGCVRRNCSAQDDNCAKGYATVSTPGCAEELLRSG